MEFFTDKFFKLVLFIGVILFYGATYLRVLITYIKTNVNHYDFEESKDKGFVILFTISAINLFFSRYVKYFGDLSFVFGSFLVNVNSIGALFLLASIMLLIYAQNSLGKSWKIGLEKETKTELIKTGMYKYTRHPIYVAMLLFFTSLFLLLPTILILVLVIGNYAAIISTAKKEEEFLIEEFGDDYRKYMQEVNFLFPKIK